MKKALVLLVALFATLIVFAQTSKNVSDQKLCESTRETNTASAWLIYLKKFPTGICVPEAQFAVGNNYLVAQQNSEEALNWFLKAAEQGHAKAQYNAGAMYYRGQGVPKNYGEAINWFLKAAEQGYAEAQHNAGTMYYIGQGVPKNYGEAINWFLKAARQGVVPAQYNVGIMYSRGQGVPKNKEEAQKWLMKAAEQGYAEADNYLRMMENRGKNSKDIDWYYLLRIGTIILLIFMWLAR